jgi:hypothetical protein
MLRQNHNSQLVKKKRFYGQTTAFDSEFIKSNVLIMGSELNGEARSHLRSKEKECLPLSVGHDPEDFQHQVGDPPTVLDLHSTRHRPISKQQVLFPRKKRRTKHK